MTHVAMAVTHTPGFHTDKHGTHDALTSIFKRDTLRLLSTALYTAASIALTHSLTHTHMITHTHTTNSLLY